LKGAKVTEVGNCPVELQPHRFDFALIALVFVPLLFRLVHEVLL
jgi:hypothetical protein